jgi:hypothetical protein
MTQKDYRALRHCEWDASTFGKRATKRYKELNNGARPPYQQTTAKKRDPVPVYPCGVLEATYHSLCAGTPCVFYEVTQGEFRRRLGKKWGPSFNAKFGKRATKLYRALFKKEPPYRESTDDQRDPVNIYPCGLLEQAYAQLRAEGAELDKPYREPDPSLRPSKREAEPRPNPFRQSFAHGRSKPLMEKSFAQRTADLAAGKEPDETEDDPLDRFKRDDDDPTNFNNYKDED